MVLRIDSKVVTRKEGVDRWSLEEGNFSVCHQSKATNKWVRPSILSSVPSQDCARRLISAASSQPAELRRDKRRA